MAKYSVPGIRFTEIDNSVRTNAEPGLGIGAIVMKSNKGPVNQRIMTSSYDEFTRIFGQPEELTDYGHFAAENYLTNSNQLFAIRATMGDEQYAQIQYPYTDAEADYRYQSQDVAQFKYISNEDASDLVLLDPLDGNDPVADLHTFTGSNEYTAPNADRHFYLNQKAQFCTIKDLITDAAPAIAVFKTVGVGTQSMTDIDPVSAGAGVYVEYAQNVAKDGTITKKYDDLIFKKSVWDDTTKKIAANQCIIPTTAYVVTNSEGVEVKGYKVQFTVPSADTLDEHNVAVTCWLTNDCVADLSAGQLSYAEVFRNSNFYKGKLDTSAVGFCEEPAPATKLEFLDWDDMNTKTYYVKDDEIANTVGQAAAIAYREYGMADTTEALVMADEGHYKLNVRKIPDVVQQEEKRSREGVVIEEDGRKFMTRIASEYGLELADINNDKFSLLEYCDVWSGKLNDTDDAAQKAYADEIRCYKIIYSDSMDGYFSDPTKYNENLFWIISKKDSRKAQALSVYTAALPDLVTVPWQDGMINDHASDANKTAITKMIAYPTSEVLNGTNGTYKDGYTMTMESDEEPGNGDVEQYVSNKQNQLIITAIGPGKYGNDIGVSIITTECADVPALNHQNAFCWKYKYDDEDLVNADDTSVDFTWKKVYRINVYAKLKTQTAEAAWGTGMDALLKDPVESWFVSNDPQAKDGEGNSLYAPNVINGHSEYIYVSRASVTDAMTGNGQYAQPVQTYAIYGLTGGTNSKKNNIAEKTAALKLYADRQKSDFDILFNVEAIDTFNGKQRYASHQRKIAEIAAARTMDIGVIQLTSKEAKTVKRQLSEGKGFSFNNGSYVAPYAGYDKYYNSVLASWIYLPKSIAGACAMANCDMRYYPWMAPAGVQRGTITYTSNQLARLSDDEIGQLYDNNINTSRLCGAYGEVLWGQKTALKKESALNRINVRRCMNYIEKQLEQMMTPYLFQQNTANTRASAKNSIDSFLSRVKAAEGVIDYATSVVEDDDDPHIMLVNITVKPAESIEFIDVKITVTRDSVTTEEG